MRRDLALSATLVVMLLAGVACAAPAPEVAQAGTPAVGPEVMDTPQARPVPSTPEPSATVAPPPTPTPFPTATPDDPTWEDPTIGVERREIIVNEPRTGNPVRLHMVRLDPTVIDFQVHYVPRSANSIPGWQEETGALVVVNGGFFDGDFNTDGIVILDGDVYGQSPDREERIGVGGMFGVKDGQVSILPLPRAGVPPEATDFDYATQSYPMLLMPGNEPAFNRETGQAAERTVVAIDTSGRVIFIVVRTAIFTLYGLSQTLAEIDELNLDAALNLDGGKSSGMEVRAGPEHTHWEAATVLPIVIAAYPKEGVPVAPTAAFGLVNE